MFRNKANYFLRKLALNSVDMSTTKKAKKRLQVVYENDTTEPSNSKQLKNEEESFEPKNWQAVLENIKKMRKGTEAPVDTMGCEKCFDDKADEKTKRFQILIALMLSSQTKDEVTFAACQKLKTFGFTPQHLSQSDPSELEKLLYPVSFYKTKAKSIKAASKIVMDEYEGDIPNTVETLKKLPGVGPKMAHICMKSAFGITSGIGVDVHVHRIANRLKWVPKPTNDPEKTRIELEKWLPFEYWSEVNLAFVGFGQTICSAKSPNCSSCSNQELCPSAFKANSDKKGKSK